MEKIIRPKIADIATLAEHEETLKTYCKECENGFRKWQSSGKIYQLLKEELSLLTKGHCSFCDGFPFNDMSKDTIEHYYPKAEYKEKTYEWENLFICCDKCQSYANADKPFKATLKMDDSAYRFDQYFWFDAQEGEVMVLENLDEDKRIKAIDFLNRYGINKSEQRCKSRRRRYEELLILFKENTKERDVEPFRFVFDVALKTFELQPQK